MKGKDTMKTVIWMLAALVGLSGLLSAAENGKSPAILLQEALYQEQTEGNLDKAIELYDQVLEQAADVERLAARATYQLGLCHLKKGDEAAAAEYFRKAVSNYPKQTSVAKKAQVELDKIAPNQETFTYSFGPVLKQTINDDGVGKDFMFDLDNGKSYSASNVQKANEPLNNTFSVEDFVMKNGVDLFGETSKKSLMGVNMIVFPVHNERWEMSPQDVIEQVSLGKPGTPTLLSADGELPKTYVFKTGQGGMGILQILEMQDGKAPRHFKIQYKMLHETTDQVVIFKDSFEEGNNAPTGWEKGQSVAGVSYVWDQKHGSDGTSSLCMKKTAQKYFPIAQWTRSIEYTGDARELSVSAYVLAKKAYKAVIDALFLDDKGEWIKHEWVSYIGAKEAGDPPANHNWKEYSGTVDIPGNTKTIVIGLQMYGPGMVCFDEVEVAYTDISDDVVSKKRSYTISDNMVLDIDSGASILVDADIPVEYDLGWDNDGGGVLMVNPLGTSKMLALTGAKQGNWNGAIKSAKKSLPLLKKKGSRGILANTASFCAVLSDQENLYVIEITDYSPEKATLNVLKLEDTKSTAKSDALKAENLIAEGWKLWGQRKLAEAEAKFKEAIRNDPDNDGAYQGLGWAQLNQGKKQNAEVSFKKCVKLNPKNSAALNGLGWIEHGRGNIDIAIKWWDKAVRASKGTATASLSGLTQVYMERQDYAKAVKYYQMWLKAEPNNQDAKDGLDKAKAAMK